MLIANTNRSTRRKILPSFTLLIALIPFTQISASPITFNNGLSNDITTAVGEVIINSNTTVNLLTPGSIATTGTQDMGVIVSDTSTFNLQSGTIDTSGIQAMGIRASGSATVNVSGGAITTSNTQAFGINLNDSSVLNMSGGTISTTGTQGFGVDVNGSATANILGGIITTSGIQGMVISNASLTNIMGGFLSGSGSQGFELHNSGVINIYGSSFNTGFGSITGGSGTLTGTLADGTALNAFYSNGTAGSINLILADVPEPESLILLGMALLSLRIRRKQLARAS